MSWKNQASKWSISVAMNHYAQILNRLVLRFTLLMKTFDLIHAQHTVLYNFLEIAILTLFIFISRTHRHWDVLLPK